MNGKTVLIIGGIAIAGLVVFEIMSSGAVSSALKSAMTGALTNSINPSVQPSQSSSVPTTNDLGVQPGVSGSDIRFTENITYSPVTETTNSSYENTSTNVISESSYNSTQNNIQVTKSNKQTGLLNGLIPIG